MASGQRAYGRSLSANAFDGYGAVQLGILGGLMVLSLYHLRIRRQPSSDVFHDLNLAELHRFASDEMDIVCSVFLSRPKKGGHEIDELDGSSLALICVRTKEKRQVSNFTYNRTGVEKPLHRPAREGHTPEIGPCEMT